MHARVGHAFFITHNYLVTQAGRTSSCSPLPQARLHCLKRSALSLFSKNWRDIASTARSSMAVEWRNGYCGLTEEGHSDCLADARGAWSLSEEQARSQESAAAVCADRCAECPRCRFVSLSRHARECSWFADCDRSQLLTKEQGFRSARVDRQAGHGWPRLAAAAFDQSEGALPLRLFHIPKTAGSSLHLELTRAYSARVHGTAWSSERCYPEFYDERSINVVILREPYATH